MAGRTGGADHVAQVVFDVGALQPQFARERRDRSRLDAEHRQQIAADRQRERSACCSNDAIALLTGRRSDVLPSGSARPADDGAATATTAGAAIAAIMSRRFMRGDSLTRAA